MAHSITWTPLADSNLMHMRAAGLPWPVVARQLQVGRSAVIEHARSLGVLPKSRLPQPKAAPLVARVDRAPLPAGHPLTWGAITAGTPSDNTPYPYPVFL
jgi:hypothetical protein